MKFLMLMKMIKRYLLNKGEGKDKKGLNFFSDEALAKRIYKDQFLDEGGLPLYNDEELARKLQKEFDAGQPGKKDHSLIDDEAFAKQLQEQFNQTHVPVCNDEELARKLQKEFDAGQPGKKDDSAIDDWAFAKKLQEEIENSPFKSRMTLKEIEISPPKSRMTLEEIEKIQKQEDATYQILNTQGLIPCLESIEKGSTAKPRTIYELQSGLFLAITAALTKECPQAISPAALRAQRDVNFEQYPRFKN